MLLSVWVRSTDFAAWYCCDSVDCCRDALWWLSAYRNHRMAVIQSLVLLLTTVLLGEYHLQSINCHKINKGTYLLRAKCRKYAALEWRNETEYLCLSEHVILLYFSKAQSLVSQKVTWVCLIWLLPSWSIYPSYSVTLLHHFSISIFIKCIIFVQSNIYCYMQQLIFPVKGIHFLPLDVQGDIPSSTYSVFKQKTTDIVGCYPYEAKFTVDGIWKVFVLNQWTELIHVI